MKKSSTSTQDESAPKNCAILYHIQVTNF